MGGFRTALAFPHVPGGPGHALSPPERHTDHRRRRFSMLRPLPLFIIALQACLGVVVVVVAQQAIQVDDNDASIVYTPADSWHRSTAVSALDAGGHHMVTTDADATATFTFTGTGIAFMAPLFADTVTTLATLDDGAPVLINMEDPTQTPEADGPSTVASAILWSSMNLVYGPHTLVLSVSPTGEYGLVDMLVYYVPGVTTTAAPSTSSFSAATSSVETNFALETGVVSPSTRRGLSIALGIVCSIVGIVILTAGFIFWRRRQRKKEEHALWLQTQKEEQEGAGNGAPVMEEVNDGITAPRGHRYKSIPSLKKMAAASSSDVGSYDEQGVAVGGGAAGGGGGGGPRYYSSGAAKQAGQGSKLRNVVASQEAHTRSSATGTAAEGSSSASSSSPRKFTLTPSNAQFRT